MQFTTVRQMLVLIGCGLLIGCNDAVPRSPLNEAKSTQIDVVEHFDQAEDRIDDLGDSLENIDTQIVQLRTERDQLQEKVNAQRDRIDQLEQELEAAKSELAAAPTAEPTDSDLDPPPKPTRVKPNADVVAP